MVGRRNVYQLRSTDDHHNCTSSLLAQTPASGGIEAGWRGRFDLGLDQVCRKAQTKAELFGAHVKIEQEGETSLRLANSTEAF